MKILIVATCVDKAREFGSNTIWIKNLLSNISEEEKKSITLLLQPEGVDILHVLYPDIPYIVSSISEHGQASLFHPITMYQSARQFQRFVNNSNFDCIFTFHFFPFFTRLRFNCKKVAIVHDLAPLYKEIKDKGDFKLKFLFPYYLKCQLETCDKIIAISNFVKTDIIKHFSYANPQKIETVHNPVEITSTVAKKPQQLDYSGKFILFVGRDVPYKGAKTAIKAIELLNRNEYKLICVSKVESNWKKNVQPYINKHHLESKVIQLQGLTSEELKWLYQNAALFVTPSKHEGFGYTPIEAAMYECPVISSKCDSLLEVTMGLVNYYEPVADSYALATKIAEVLDNPASKAQLTEIASIFKEKYKPAKQAEEIIKILKE